MKKKIVMFAVLTICFSTLYAQKTINFSEGSFESIKTMAAREKKQIFLDFTTDWCVFCKKMENIVYTNEDVYNNFNSKYVCFKVDAEKGEGISLALRYKVEAFPTFIIVDSSGWTLHRAAGYLKVNDFMKFSNDAQNQETRFGTLKRKYEGGERNPEFIRNYITNCNLVALPNSYINDVLNWYIFTLKSDALFTRENLNLIRYNIYYKNSKVIELYFNNRKEFIKSCGKEMIDTIDFDLSVNRLYDSYSSLNEDTLKTIIKDFNESDNDRKDEFNLYIHTIYYQMKEDWENYANYSVKYIEDFTKLNLPSTTLNDFSYIFYLNVKDKSNLEKALNWSKKSLEIEENYFNLDTYASLLYKLEKYDDASVYALKAIDRGKIDGEDYSGTDELLLKIKSKK